MPVTSGYPNGCKLETTEFPNNVTETLLFEESIAVFAAHSSKAVFAFKPGAEVGTV